MKQIVITKYGDTDVLKIQERKDPEPLPGEVLIKVKAMASTLPIFSPERGFTLTRQSPPVWWGMKYPGLLKPPVRVSRLR